MKPHFATDEKLAMEALIAIQNKVTGADRDLIAKSLAEQTNKIIVNPFNGESAQDLLASLRETGICKLPFRPSKEICAEVVEYYKNTPCYNTHVPVYSDHIARPVKETAEKWNYGSYTLEQSMRAPHLIEMALSKPILDIVAAYLGCLPTLYSMNTFWTFPSKASAGLTHDYHRDEDDYRFVAVFVYWTDVEKSEGEFYFIPETHDYRAVDRFIAEKQAEGRERLPENIKNFDEFRRMNGGNGYANAETYENLFKGKIQMVDGSAGAGFIADTFAVHRGSMPATRPRLTTWYRFGLYANEAYHIDKTEPVSRDIVANRIDLNDERNKFICRLVVK